MIKRLLETIVRIAFALLTLRFTMDTLRSPRTLAPEAVEVVTGGGLIKR